MSERNVDTESADANDRFRPAQVLLERLGQAPFQYGHDVHITASPRHFQWLMERFEEIRLNLDGMAEIALFNTCGDEESEAFIKTCHSDATIALTVLQKRVSNEVTRLQNEELSS